MTSLKLNESWRSEVTALLGILERCGAFRARQPALAESANKRLAKLLSQRTRLAVAGAQGVGKSTLVTALLAGPDCQEPPVPVAQREETRIPIITRVGSRPLIRGVSEGGVLVQEGEFTVDEVRARTSANNKLWDKVRFAGLLSVELESPHFALPPELDVIDLPGVSGNLAGVSEWARVNLLQNAAQFTVFVVGSNQTIDTVEDEANLIRAFGPLMTRSIFVQNVWQGYDDPIDEVEKHNREFLRKHVGGAFHYLRLDCDQALRERRGGESPAMRGMLHALGPLWSMDGEALADEEARRLADQVAATRATVQIELLSAEGQDAAARAAQGQVDAVRTAIDAAEKDMKAFLAAQKSGATNDLRLATHKAFTEFDDELREFLSADRAVTEKLLERELATLMGQLTLKLREAASQRLKTAAEDASQRMARALQVDTGSPAMSFDVGAPELVLETLRGAVRGLAYAMKAAAGIAGGLLGFEVGAQLGGFGGPVGAIVGGLLGALVGWLGQKVVHKYIEAPLARSQLERVRLNLGPKLEESRAQAEQQLGAAVATAINELEVKISAVFADHRTASEHSASAPRPRTANAGFLRQELRSLEVAADDLMTIIGRVSRAVVSTQEVQA